MAQISLYVDEDLLQQITVAAQKAQLSISKWVIEQLKPKVEPLYSAEFIALLETGYEDDSFVAPERLPDSYNIPRVDF